MKRSHKIISGVVLSIGLATAAGAYATYKHGYDEAKASFVVSYVSDKLALNETQEQKLAVLADKVIALKSDFRQNAVPLHSEIKDLIAQDSFNQQQALSLINEKTQLVNNAAPEVVSAFASFLDGLDDTQKSKVLDFLDKKGHHRGHGWSDDKSD